MALKIFNSPFKVTQTFGNKLIIDGKDYYAQFGLDGHEGLDLVPTTSDWTIYSLPYPGQVVKDIDMGDKGGAYGNHCTIWYKEINEAWMYCHLSSNKVYVDQEIPPVYPLGTMGASGNTMGAHLHINRFEVDARGYRQNRNNGYLGGIDPLEFLTKHSPPEEETDEDPSKERGIEILDAYRTERKQGPEGNYEGFVNAIIGSDRAISGKEQEIVRLQEQMKKLEEGSEEEKKALEETLKDACNKEKEELKQDWQSNVESAKRDIRKEYEALLIRKVEKISLLTIIRLKIKRALGVSSNE